MKIRSSVLILLSITTYLCQAAPQRYGGQDNQLPIKPCYLGQCILANCQDRTCDLYRRTSPSGWWNYVNKSCDLSQEEDGSVLALCKNNTQKLECASLDGEENNWGPLYKKNKLHSIRNVLAMTCG